MEVPLNNSAVSSNGEHPTASSAKAVWCDNPEDHNDVCCSSSHKEDMTVTSSGEKMSSNQMVQSMLEKLSSEKTRQRKRIEAMAADSSERLRAGEKPPEKEGNREYAAGRHCTCSAAESRGETIEKFLQRERLANAKNRAADIIFHSSFTVRDSVVGATDQSNGFLSTSMSAIISDNDDEGYEAINESDVIEMLLDEIRNLRAKLSAVEQEHAKGDQEFASKPSSAAAKDATQDFDENVKSTAKSVTEVEDLVKQMVEVKGEESSLLQCKIDQQETTREDTKVADLQGKLEHTHGSDISDADISTNEAISSLQFQEMKGKVWRLEGELKVAQDIVAQKNVEIDCLKARCSNSTILTHTESI